MANEDVIFTIAGKNHFLDFRDALQLAPLSEYASVYCRGGRGENGEKRYRSGIKLTMTDSTISGKNFFEYLVMPYVLDQVLSVCRKNVGDMHSGTQALEEQIGVLCVKQAMILDALRKGSKAGVQSCARIVNGKGHVKGPAAEIGQTLKEVYDAVKQVSDLQTQASPAPYTEYCFKEQKVNPYRFYVDPATNTVDKSLNMCSQIEIRRTHFKTDEKTGKNVESTMPWSVSIMNCYSKPLKNEKTGLTYFRPNDTANKDQRQTFMRISDDQMYEACYAVSRFIFVWETAMAARMVQNGRKIRNNEKGE